MDRGALTQKRLRTTGLKFILLPKVLEANALDGRLLCRITYCVQPIQVVMAKGHNEQLSFYLFHSLQQTLYYRWILQYLDQEWISYIKRLIRQWQFCIIWEAEIKIWNS